MQLISEISQIFKLRKLPLWVKIYEILATGPRSGMVEIITDAQSLDEIHKKMNGGNLRDYFINLSKKERGEKK